MSNLSPSILRRRAVTALLCVCMGATACGRGPVAPSSAEDEAPIVIVTNDADADGAPSVSIWRQVAPRPLEVPAGGVLGIELDHPAERLLARVGGVEAHPVAIDSRTWVLIVPMLDDLGPAVPVELTVGDHEVQFDVAVTPPHTSNESPRSVLRDFVELTYSVADDVAGAEGDELRLQAQDLEEALASMTDAEAAIIAEVVVASGAREHAGAATVRDNADGTRTLGQPLVEVSLKCAWSIVTAVYKLTKQANLAPTLDCSFSGVQGDPTLTTARVAEGTTFTVRCTASEPGEGLANIEVEPIGDSGATLTGSTFSVSAGSATVPAPTPNAQTQTLSFTVAIAVTGHVRPLQFDVRATDAPSFAVPRTAVRSYAVMVDEIVAPEASTFTVDRTEVPVGETFELRLVLEDPTTAGAAGEPSGLSVAMMQPSPNVDPGVYGPVHFGVESRVFSFSASAGAAGSIPTLVHDIGPNPVERTFQGRCLSTGPAVVGLTFSDADDNWNATNVQFECVAPASDKHCSIGSDCTDGEQCALSSEEAPICRPCTGTACGPDDERFVQVEWLETLAPSSTVCSTDTPQPSDEVVRELHSSLLQVAREYCGDGGWIELHGAPSFEGCTQIGESAQALWTMGGYWVCGG